MGLFIRQNENRSHLQEKLAEELRQRASQQAAGLEPNDQTKDSNYVKDTEQTSDRAWIGLVVAVLVIAGIVIFVVTR